MFPPEVKVGLLDPPPNNPKPSMNISRRRSKTEVSSGLASESTYGVEEMFDDIDDTDMIDAGESWWPSSSSTPDII